MPTLFDLCTCVYSPEMEFMSWKAYKGESHSGNTSSLYHANPMKTSRRPLFRPPISVQRRTTSYLVTTSSAAILPFSGLHKITKHRASFCSHSYSPKHRYINRFRYLLSGASGGGNWRHSIRKPMQLAMAERKTFRLPGLGAEK